MRCTYEHNRSQLNGHNISRLICHGRSGSMEAFSSCMIVFVYHPDRGGVPPRGGGEEMGVSGYRGRRACGGCAGGTEVRPPVDPLPSRASACSLRNYPVTHSLCVRSLLVVGCLDVVISCPIPTHLLHSPHHLEG